VIVLEEECAFARLDAQRVASIARRISRAAEEARAMGLSVFGGSGNGTLRWHAEHGNGPITQGALVVAHLDGSFDGGDGAEHQDELGLTRGEDGA
jgi:hypothetical protein